MKTSEAHTSVLVFLILYLGVTPVTTDGDNTQIKIFSSLQDEQPVHRFLAPYPAGANMTLTCNARTGKPQWLEWSERIGSNSTTNRDTGINTVKFNIPALSHTDHGRQLSCVTENETTTVAIHVIDEIPALEISFSSSNQMPVIVIDQAPVPRDRKATLTCTTKGLDRLLELCWFENNREIKCQEEKKNTKKNRDIVSVTVDTNDVGSVMQCRPKLKHGDALSAEAIDMFEKIFNDVKREVQMNNTSALPKLELSYEIRGEEVTIPTDNKTVNLQSNETIRLTCQMKSKNDLVLCWDRNNRTKTCQENHSEFQRGKVVVSVSKADNGATFACRVKSNDRATNNVQQKIIMLFPGTTRRQKRITPSKKPPLTSAEQMTPSPLPVEQRMYQQYLNIFLYISVASIIAVILSLAVYLMKRNQYKAVRTHVRAIIEDLEDNAQGMTSND